MRKIWIAAGLLMMFGKLPAQTTDSLYGGQLKEASVHSRWKSDLDRYHYNQTKYYITTILPYVNATTQLFKEVNEKENDPSISRKEYKRFITARQDEMKNRFEDKIKALNVTQGQLLIKLIARQTNLNIYKMVSEVKNPIAAMKWQSWALLNGMNLDRKYHPEEEPMLESIMNELGYPLPDGYASN